MIDLASNRSLWKGLDYFQDKKVKSWKKIEEDIYEGIIKGSDDNTYNVHIDLKHARRSTCSCPFAIGRRVICKHMVALCFTVDPQTATDFLKQIEMEEQENEEREKQHYADLLKYVNSLSKKALREQLYQALIELEERSDWY